MKHLDGVTVVAVILIASFAIDRVVSALLFLLSLSKSFPEPASKKYQVWYFCIAGILAIFVIAYWGNVRILAAVGYPPDPNPVLDALLTGIVLVGGAERLATMLKLPGAAGAGPSDP